MKKHNKLLRVLGILSIIVIALISISHLIFLIVAENNYKHNTKAWQNYNYTGLIYNQHDFPDLKFGFGNIPDNGCGAVSIYNILKLENKEPDFPYIIKQFDLCGENIFGLGGSQPTKVISLLKRYGFKVSFSLNFSNFENIAKQSKYAIYLYYGMNGIVPFGHYQLMYNYDGEKFDTLNITGKYTFEEITNIQNTVIRILISIN